MESNKKPMTTFTQLKAWQKSHALVLAIYQATQSFPSQEKFGLTNQIRRAAVSITSNLAEGFGRESYKDKIRFYYQANGSLIEVENQLLISRDVNYLREIDFQEIALIVKEAHILLQGLIKKSKLDA